MIERGRRASACCCRVLSFALTCSTPVPPPPLLLLMWLFSPCFFPVRCESCRGARRRAPDSCHVEEIRHAYFVRRGGEIMYYCCLCCCCYSCYSVNCYYFCRIAWGSPILELNNHPFFNLSAVAAGTSERVDVHRDALHPSAWCAPNVAN